MFDGVITPVTCANTGRVTSTVLKAMNFSEDIVLPERSLTDVKILIWYSVSLVRLAAGYRVKLRPELLMLGLPDIFTQLLKPSSET